MSDFPHPQRHGDASEPVGEYPRVGQTGTEALSADPKPARTWCACFQRYQPNRSLCDANNCPVVNLSRRALDAEVADFLTSRGVQS